jgi:hypothetical protein
MKNELNAVNKIQYKGYSADGIEVMGRWDPYLSLSLLLLLNGMVFSRDSKRPLWKRHKIAVYKTTIKINESQSLSCTLSFFLSLFPFIPRYFEILVLLYVYRENEQ